MMNSNESHQKLVAASVHELLILFAPRRPLQAADEDARLPQLHISATSDSDDLSAVARFEIVLASFTGPLCTDASDRDEVVQSTWPRRAAARSVAARDYILTNARACSGRRCRVRLRLHDRARAADVRKYARSRRADGIRTAGTLRGKQVGLLGVDRSGGPGCTPSILGCA